MARNIHYKSVLPSRFSYMAFQPKDGEYPGAVRWQVFNSSLFIHWLLASFFLVCLIPVVGFSDVWSADVGAQLAQSQQLADGAGWYFSHPFPEADPTGDWFPYHFSGRVGNEYVVLAKHPMFTLLVAGLLKVGGLGMVMAFSAISTSTAAVGVAVLAHTTVNKRSSIVLLWVLATMSPLAFDSYLGYAHTFAAALTVWSMVGVVVHVRSGRLVHYGLPASCLLAAGGPLVRSEAVLAGIALGMAVAITSVRWWTKAQRRLALFGGSLVVVSNGIGFTFDRFITIKADNYIGNLATPEAWLPGRFQGFNATWLWADSSGWRVQDLLLVTVPICWYLAGKTTGRSSTLSNRYLAVGAGLVTLWWVLDPQHIVPGLLLAFPLLALLASLLTTEIFDTPVPIVGLVAFVLFAGAVILTQYPQGGTAEWGGRYFAAGIPFILVGLSSGVDRLLIGPKHQLWRSVTPVALASLLLISAGLGGLRQSKLLVGQLGASVQNVTAATKGPTQDNNVVVVSTSNAIRRLLWDHTSDSPWLLVPPEDLGHAMARLDEAGVVRVVVIAERHQETDRTIGPYIDVEVVEPWATSPVEILAFNAE